MNIMQKIAALPGAKMSRAGSQITMCCPAHNDSTPSLTITEKDGKILWHCHAGCSQEDVAAAFSTHGIELYERKEPKRELTYAPVKKDRWTPDFELLLKRRPEFVWRYLDASGEKTLGYVCRWTGATGCKEIRPIIPCRDQDGHVHWQVRAMPEPRPLYGLELLAQHPDKPVLIVEGEKAADAGRNNPAFAGYIVITWPGGAKAVSKADWRPLKGRTVKIWPDHDDPGRKAAQEITKILMELNNA
jgi:hypothetical protein